MPSPHSAHPSRLDGPDGEAIAYLAERRTSPSFSSSGLMWLGGFNSTMDGTKANALALWAKRHGRECVRFDYSGHGASSGRLEDGTITKWLAQSAAVFDEITAGPQILVGSSMGGWIALLLARKHLQERSPGDSRIRAIILIAPAVDMSEVLMWNRFSDEIKHKVETTGVYHRPSRYGDGDYPITKALIEDGRNHLILGEAFDPGCPVRILHGLEDPDVPWEHGVATAQALGGDDVTVTLIKGGDHRLSEDEDILRMIRTVERLSEKVDRV